MWNQTIMQRYLGEKAKRNKNDFGAILLFHFRDSLMAAWFGGPLLYLLSLGPVGYCQLALSISTVCLQLRGVYSLTSVTLT